MRDGRPRVRWLLYFVALSAVIAATSLINGLLLAAGVWGGVDTVVVGLVVAVVVFNILVLRDFNQPSGAAPQPASHPPPPVTPGPATPHGATPAASCPRCGAPVSPDMAEGLCPRCLMAMNAAAPTDVPTANAGPAGTRIMRERPAPIPIGEVAKRFPQLEILACLGSGGMGVVYKARQPHLNRVVALKILTPGREEEPGFADRFTREAQLLARLNHQHIVTLYDFGKVDGWFYFLMEYVDGVTLRELLHTKKLSPEQALAIVPKICDALQYAHEHGIVHRDIKPENVLIDQSGHVKIADFGIAKVIGGESGQPSITRDEQVIGTPHYMAPEQVERPQQVDHRADIYSLGVVFYEMLTGELPLGKFAPPSQRVHVDVRLDEIVLHALEKEPARRYQHAGQVKTDVENVAHTPEATPAGAAEPQASTRAGCGLSALLVGTRGGVRVLHWTGIVLEWVVITALGGLAFFLFSSIAEMRFGILESCIIAVFPATLWTVLWVARCWSLPVERLVDLDAAAPAGDPGVKPVSTSEARELLKWPAAGILGIGLCFPVVAVLYLAFGQSSVGFPGIFGIPYAIGMGLVIISGASQMQKLQNYRMARLAAILSLIVALPALPLAAFPIWGLLVLHRPDVRAAFTDMRRRKPHVAPASAAWTPVVIIAGIAVLLTAALLIAIYRPFASRGPKPSPEEVVRVQNQLRDALAQRLAEGGWRLDGLNVSVSPDLKRAECHWDKIWKNGLREVPPPRAEIRIRRQADGLWLVHGEYEFQSLRFSVATPASESSFRVPPEANDGDLANAHLPLWAAVVNPPSGLPAGHRPDDHEGFLAANDLVAQRRVGWIERQVFPAGKEAQKGSSLSCVMIPDGAAEHGVAGLEGIQNRVHGHGYRHVQPHLA